MDILNILNESGELSSEQIESVKKFTYKWDVSYFQTILETRIVSEARLADCLSEQLKLDRIFSIDQSDFGPQAFGFISYKHAKSLEMMPLGITEDGEYHIVVSDPTNDAMLEFLEKVITSSKIKLSVSERRIVLKSIDEFYPTGLQVPSLVRFGTDMRGDGE